LQNGRKHEMAHEYDLSKGNAPLRDEIASTEIFFLNKKIGKPEAKVIIESKLNKVFKGASGVDVQYLEVKDNYNPYIHIRGNYKIRYLKKQVLSINVSHEIVGAKVCQECDVVMELGEARPGEEKKKRKLDILVVLKAHHEHGDVDLAFDPNGKKMNPDKLMGWKKEPGPSDFLETNGDEVRRFAVTIEQAIDMLRKQITRRPTDAVRIIEEIFEVSKVEVILSPVYIYTLKYQDDTRKIQIDAINQSFKIIS